MIVFFGNKQLNFMAKAITLNYRKDKVTKIFCKHIVTVAQPIKMSGITMKEDSKHLQHQVISDICKGREVKLRNISLQPHGLPLTEKYPLLLYIPF